LLTTTSNDELGQEEDKIAPLFVEEVHWGDHFHVSLVPEGEPLIMCHLDQVWDIPQVR